MFVGLQVTGSSMVVQDGREAVLRPGDMAPYDTTRPYTLVNENGIHQHFFRIAHSELPAARPFPPARRARASRRARLPTPRRSCPRGTSDMCGRPPAFPNQ